MSLNNFVNNGSKFCELEEDKNNFENSKFTIVSIPYEQTTSYKSGTKEGPKAIIDASKYLELYDEELDCCPCDSGICTIGELPVDYSGPKNMNHKIYMNVREILRKDKVLFSLGGEHSITPALVKAHKEMYPNISVLQLDAHADLRQEYEGTEYSHASAIKRVLDFCHSVQVGIRSISYEEIKFLKTTDKTKIFYAFDLFKNYDKKVQKIVDSLSDDVYITIDLDVLDPSIMPSVGTPEPGGLGWYEILEILKSVALKKNIIGVDIVELLPDKNNISPDFTTAKLIYKLIGYIDNIKKTERRRN